MRRKSPSAKEQHQGHMIQAPSRTSSLACVFPHTSTYSCTHTHRVGSHPGMATCQEDSITLTQISALLSRILGLNSHLGVVILFFSLKLRYSLPLCPTFLLMVPTVSYTRMALWVSPTSTEHSRQQNVGARLPRVDCAATLSVSSSGL